MALKIVYKICYEIDVHKTFVVACIASTNKQGATTYESHHFSTYTKGLKELLQWLLNHNCMDVCMESTGKYRQIPVYDVLKEHCTIVLAHPKYLKAIMERKLTRIMFFIHNVTVSINIIYSFLQLHNYSLLSCYPNIFLTINIISYLLLTLHQYLTFAFLNYMHIFLSSIFLSYPENRTCKYFQLHIHWLILHIV